MDEVMASSRIAQSALAALLLVLSTTAARAELPTRGYALIGTDLAALNNAVEEFHRRLPESDVRDFDVLVRVYESELVITFAHKDRPLDIYGQDPEYPILTVRLSPDGTEVLKSYFAR